MSTNEIRFDDGAAYERYMGKWSRLAGNAFLDWLAPEPGLRWLDVGCGNGAFTELLIERCAPAAVHGVDPSEAQLAFARTRAAANVAGIAEYRIGDAMALPFGEDAFDAAVMPLVIFFVPEPAKGVAEMVRIVRAGGIVSAYGWDLLGGGFPYDALWSQMRAMGIEVPLPSSPDASRIEVLRDLWTNAGLESIETRQITVQRTFDDFEDFWTTVRGGPSVNRGISTMSLENREILKTKMRQQLPADAGGRITYSARANAVKGRVRG
jgi:ubiquinone/menaquinone biosynthesis C-methylase UbiE